MIFERFDVVVVPFPFTDKTARIRRPAVVLSPASFGEATGQSLLAMITTAQKSSWPGDLHLRDLKSAGVKHGCVVRLKLFTLVNSLIVRRLGGLDAADSAAVGRSVAEHLSVGAEIVGALSGACSTSD